VDVTLTVPANAALGSFEAALLVRDATHVLTTTVPVLVNVGARTPSLTFGGDLSSSDLYDNHRLFGGYDRGLLGSNLRRPTLGDWRFYFFEIPEQGIYGAPVGYKVLIRTAWVGYPSDVDTFAFARTGADAASQGDGTWYGAFTLRQAGKSEEMTRPENRTITNGPEEVVAYDLAHGLNVIALRAFQLRGLEADVRLVSGQAGWVNTPTNVDVATRDLAGRAPLAFISNLDLPALRASAVGPAQTTAFTDVGIAQDVQSWWNFPAWGEWMSRGSFTYIVDVQKALILEVAIQGKTDVDDLDLGVFRNAAGAPCEWDPALQDPLTSLPGYWKTCDVDPEEYLVVDPAVWNYNADGDADERVKWIAPQDGQYLVKVLGYTVLADPGHFDFQVSVTLDTGTGYQVYEAPKPAEIVNGTTPLPAFTRVPLNMTWDFPPATADDAYGGAVLLGLPNAPGVLVVPVAVLLDRAPPAVTAFKINALDGDLDRATNRTTNDPSPVLVVSVEDLDRGQLVAASARVLLDGVDVTPLATVSILYSTRNNRAGLWEGTIAFAPPALAEGTHTVEARIADRAGNSAVGTFTFLEDRTGPVFSLSGALLQYTRAPSYTVTGTTEIGAQVNVRGLWYPVAPDGSFSIPVPLLNGTNALAVTAADWFDVDPGGNPLPGNDRTIVQTVVRDLLAPSFDRFRADPGGVTRESEAVVRGIASDLLADSEAGSPLDLVVTVDDGTTNATVPVLADGSFRIAVPLVEGANVITATATDPVGNVGVASLSVTRDTTPPALQVSLPPATTVTTGTVTVEGTTDAGAFVTVNGFLVPSPGGRFLVNVTLSPGANVLVVQTRDAIGNIAEQRFTVTYQTETGLSLPLVGIVLVVGALAGALIAVLLVRRGVRIPGLARGRPPEEGEASLEEAEAAGPPQAKSEAIEEVSEEAPAEEALAEEAAEGPAEESEDPRVAKLRTAYEEGRISKEVYEQNLRRIRGPGGV
jgi:hypothetical protein